MKNRYVGILILALYSGCMLHARDGSLVKFSNDRRDKQKQGPKRTVAKITKPIKHADDAAVPASAYDVDRIAAKIYTEDGVVIITQSDVERKGLNGEDRTLEEIVLEQLMYSDAKKYKMVPTEEALDKHLLAVQRDNNLTRKQLEELFEQAGYKTYEEGRAQFGVTYAVQSIIDFKVRSQLKNIPEREVRAFFDAHPDKQEAAYEVARAVVSAEQYADRAAVEQAIAQAKKEGKMLPADWSEPFWIEKNQLAADKAYFASMKIGEISVGKIDAGYELFMMKDKKEERVRTFEERTPEIVAQLRAERGNKLFEEYKKHLLDTMTVVYG